MDDKKLSLSIVHDFFLEYAGAEKCTEAISDLYPQAPVFSFAENKNVNTFLQNRTTKPLLNWFSHLKNNHRFYLPLYPIFTQFIRPKSKIIISSSYAFAKNIPKRKDQIHICYCHTPARYLHGFSEMYVQEQNKIPKSMLRSIIEHLRKWDIEKSKDVDYFIATCKNVQNRIKKYYNRESTIIHPFVDTNKFTPKGEKENYYLYVGRLALPYKRVDIVIQACNILGRNLKIIGSGRDMDYLKELGGNTIEFLGSINDEKIVAGYMQKAKAVIFPSQDDFGIVPLEAQACGTPVIGYGYGGIKETVKDGKTGHFFYNQTTKSLVQAINNFEKREFNFLECRKNSLRFEKTIFQEKINQYIINQNIKNCVN